MGKGGKTENRTVTTAKNTSGVLSMDSNNGMALSGVTFDKSTVNVTDGGAIKAMSGVASESLAAAKEAMNSVMNNTGRMVTGALKTNDDIATKALVSSKDNLTNSLKYSADTYGKALAFNNNAMNNSYSLVGKMISADQAATRNAMSNSAGATQSALSIIHNAVENKTANSGVEIAKVVKVSVMALAIAFAIRGLK